MKTIFTLLALFSINTFALCENELVSFEIRLTQETFSLGYENGTSNFQEGDQVIATNKITQKTSIFPIGIFEDDQAGNFNVVAENDEGETIEIYHDHETWYMGLTSSYISLKDDEFKLNDIKNCSFDELFIFPLSSN